MIDIAYKYSEQLGELMMDTWYDDKYKFYYSSNQRVPFTLNAELTNCRSFVVIDTSAHKVIGFIEYWFDSETDSVSGLTAINFTDKKMLFGRDLCQVIDDIFCKYHFNRLEFSVIRGNPIEDSYDKMVQKHGGRIIGTRTSLVKLIDGAMYDDKLYEIMRENYLHAKDVKNKKTESIRICGKCPFGDPERYEKHFAICSTLQRDDLIDRYRSAAGSIHDIRESIKALFNGTSPDMTDCSADALFELNISQEPYFQEAYIIEEEFARRRLKLPFLIETLPWRKNDNEKGE